MGKAPSKRLGRYELFEVIGKGGMGEVYRAIQHGPAGFQKEVALKLLHESASSEKARKELVAEARLGGIFRHPNLVEVLDLGLADGRLFVVMELVDGFTFKNLIKQAQLSPQACLEIATQICSGLSYAHNLEVDGNWLQLVHCDLKPSNILISNSGIVKIADFGISRAIGYTDDIGGIRGTPSYMSPEQIRNENISARSDIFSLGLLLFEGFVGRKLVTAKTLPELLQRLRRAEEILLEPQNIASLREIHPQLLDVLRPCFHQNPDQRYHSIAVLQRRLSVLSPLGGQGIMAVLHGEADLEEDITLSDGFIISERSMTRGNLPPFSDLFVGREKDVTTVIGSFEYGTKLLTLQGPGGVGKTQLAIHSAYQMVTNFTGGIWFIDLSEAKTLMDIVLRTADKLGIPLVEKEEDMAITAIADAIGLQEHNLYIFDNFEQVAQHAKKTLGSWAQASFSNRFLVTSQVRLNIPQEKIYTVSPLTLDDGLYFLKSRLLSLGHVQKWTEEEEQMLEQIVLTLDGLPLALEMIASRLRLLSLEQIHERLTQRFQLLQNNVQDVERHASIYNAIDWSWSLLSEVQQSVLLQLACFRGGFTLEDAEVVVDISNFPNTPMVMDIIEHLLDRSLLFISSDGPRFSMLRSIFAFAEQKLLKHESYDMVLYRHAARFGQWSDRIPELYRRGGAELLVRSQVELDNIRQAYQNAKEYQWPTELAKTVNFLAHLNAMFGPLEERIELIEGAVKEENLDDVWRLRLKLELAEAYFESYHTNIAVRLAQTCRTQFEDVLGDSERIRLLKLEALILRRQNRRRLVAEKIKDALDIAKKMNHRWYYARLLQEQAKDIYEQKGKQDEDASYELRREAIAILKEDGNQLDLAWAWNEMGRFLRKRRHEGDLSKARSCHKAAQQLAKTLNNRSLDAKASMAVANLEVMFGNSKEALRNFHRSYELIRRLGKMEESCLLLGNMASCYIHLRENKKAARMLRRAEKILKHLEGRTGLENAQMIYAGNTAILLNMRKKYDVAAAYAHRTMKLGELLEDKYLYPFIAIIYLESLAGLERFEEARALLPYIFDVKLDDFEPHVQTRLLLQQGMACALLGEKEKAIYLAQKVHRLIVSLRLKDLEVHYEFQKLRKLLEEER